MSKKFEDLAAWQTGVELAVRIYVITKKFPKDETFGIVSQIRRASISISSNIAEGSGRLSKKEAQQFISIALGSLNEVESLIIVSQRLGYIDKKDFDDIKETIKMEGGLLGGFRKYLENRRKAQIIDRNVCC